MRDEVAATFTWQEQWIPRVRAIVGARLLQPATLTQDTEEATEHSKKPETFRAMIDTLYPEGPRIELFARDTHERWETYGNELPAV